MVLDWDNPLDLSINIKHNNKFHDESKDIVKQVDFAEMLLRKLETIANPMDTYFCENGKPTVTVCVNFDFLAIWFSKFCNSIAQIWAICKIHKIKLPMT